MSGLSEDIEDSKSQLRKLAKRAKSQGLNNKDYIIGYGEPVVLDSARPDYLSMESIIENDATDSIYTTTYWKGDMVVKILGIYPEGEIKEALGIEYPDENWILDDLRGSHPRVVYITYKSPSSRNVKENIFEVFFSNLPNGWAPFGRRRRVTNHIVYKIDASNPHNFLNWINGEPLGVKG